MVSIGRTGLRTLAQLAMPPINILLCLLLVPPYGAGGAALAAVLTRLILALAAWAIVGLLVRREMESQPPSVTLGKSVEMKQAEYDIENQNINVQFTRNQKLPILDVSGTVGTLVHFTGVIITVQ